MRGAREWWTHWGFDWSDFLDNGISIETLRATEDPHAIAVATRAEAELDGC